MKNIFAFFLFAFLFATGFSQTEKGTILVSGATGLQLQASTVRYIDDGVTDVKEKVRSFTLIPSVGYFVVDNLALGLQGSIGSIAVIQEDGDKFRTVTAMVLPTVSYYIPTGGSVSPYGQVGIGFGAESDSFIPDDGDKDTFTFNGLVWNAGAGAAIFLNDFSSLNIGLQYNKVSLTNPDDTTRMVKQGTLGGNIGFSLFLK